jgi:hypothetical protein
MLKKISKKSKKMLKTPLNTPLKTAASKWACALLLPSALAALGTNAIAADLPIQRVILYKHGVGYFERSGSLQPGETAQLDFKAGDMNDVLKSLTISASNGSTIAGVRYDASDPLAKRLQDFPFTSGAEMSLAGFLDQVKGARLELRIGTETVAGSIVGARVERTAAGATDRAASRELVVLFTDAGELRTFDLSAASAVKLADPKLQITLRDYLALLNSARSRDRRSIYIDAQGPGQGQAARTLNASYMTPTAVWKSSYRLLFGPASANAEPMLEGWAIVDNTSGEDWTNVKLSVVSGRPISFITELYQPRYAIRPTAELADNRAAAPQLFEGALDSLVARETFAQNPARLRAAAPAPPVSKGQLSAPSGVAGGAVGSVAGGFAGGYYNDAKSAAETGSSLASSTDSRDLGELFEYSFSSPVTVKQGESAMLPFLNQRVKTRKLLIYSENFGQNPMNAAEIVNSTGKTLDGGPITVYDAGAYAGEALVETLKAGDKRLIGYGVDLGVRIGTLWDSGKSNVREVHLNRGVITTRNAMEETKTYTIKNVDANAKTVIVQHPQRAGYKLLDLKPSETTADSYRFEVKVAANATETFRVREERVYNETIAVSSVTPDLIAAWVQNAGSSQQAISDAGRQQLQQMLQKKREIAALDVQLKQAQADMTGLTQDQERLRRNIESLRNVAGQQDQVQQYARQLAAGESKLAGLRDTESDLRRKKAAGEADLNALLDRLQF